MEGIKFEVVRPDARKHDCQITLPQRGTKGAMAYDFFSPEEFIIEPGESHMIWTDVKAKMPMGVGLLIDVRSSMGKYRIGMANTIGVVDAKG